MRNIQRYDFIEITAAGNEQISAIFSQGDVNKSVCGFQMDNKLQAVRFMPDRIGRWEYTVTGADNSVLEQGSFECTENTGNNHGPVRTEGFGFRYADGTYFAPVGTTCYAWVHQTPELINSTIETLSTAPFNKIRMCVFPKDMPYNKNDPELYPFEGSAEDGWDVERPNYEFWSHLEDNIAALRDLGIEADLILFHPYDRWGFSKFSHGDDMQYLDYCIRRLSAYRNIWWSLANEYEMVDAKTERDWDDFGEKLAEEDIYNHLISVHNWITLYPKKPWMTHCSVQGGSPKRPSLLRGQYGLPIIIDEIGYEGDLEFGWGNLSAFELTCRAWEVVTSGGFITHGETFHREDEVLWWAKGGTLYGKSPERFKFLKDIQYEIGDISPTDLSALMNPNTESQGDGTENENSGVIRAVLALSESERTALIMGLTPSRSSNEKYRLQFYGRTCPCMSNTTLPENGTYKIEVIDVWEMTRTTVFESVSGNVRIPLPAKEGIAVLITRLSGDTLVK